MENSSDTIGNRTWEEGRIYELLFICSSYRHLYQLFIADSIKHLYSYKYFGAVKSLEFVKFTQITALNLVIWTEFYQPMQWFGACAVLNLLKPSRFFTYHQTEHSKILHSARFALNVLYGYQNKQRLLLHTSLTDWFF